MRRCDQVNAAGDSSTPFTAAFFQGWNHTSQIYLFHPFAVLSSQLIPHAMHRRTARPLASLRVVGQQAVPNTFTARYSKKKSRLLWITMTAIHLLGQALRRVRTASEMFGVELIPGSEQFRWSLDYYDPLFYPDRQKTLAQPMQEDLCRAV